MLHYSNPFIQYSELKASAIIFSIVCLVVELLSFLHHSENASTGLRSDMYSIQKDRLAHYDNFDHDRYPNTSNLYSLREKN